MKAIVGFPQASDGNIHPLGDVVSTLWDLPKRISFEIDAGEKEKKNGMGLREKQYSLSQEKSKLNQSKPKEETYDTYDKQRFPVVLYPEDLVP